MTQQMATRVSGPRQTALHPPAKGKDRLCLAITGEGVLGGGGEHLAGDMKRPCTV